MTAATSHYKLHKRPDRSFAYRQEGPAWWSQQLRRWMVTDAALIAEILRNPAFAGHDYGVAALMERFGVDLTHVEELSRHLPLAFEGRVHRVLRKEFSAAIASNTAEAMRVFEAQLRARIAELLVPGRRFCAMQELLAPATLAAVFALAGIAAPPPPGASTIPLLFDDTITVAKRLEINAILDELFQELGESMPADERYFRLAIVALSANTLLGSLGESLALTLEMNPQRRLCDTEWHRDFPATGLPLIEKRVTRDITIAGCEMKAGQRVRLFLDAAGFAKGERPLFSDLYFATGPHKCPGMSFSRRAWKSMAEQLQARPERVRLEAVAHRKRDNVFNFAEKLEVSVHG